MSKIKRKPSSFSLGQCSINPVQVITVFPLAPKFWENFNRQSSHFRGKFWKFCVIVRSKSIYQLLSTDMVRVTRFHHLQYQSILGKGHWIGFQKKVFTEFRKNFKMWKHYVTNQLLLCCQSIHIDNALRLDLLS